ILEWLAHAAAHGNPGLAFHGLNDLRILKGVIFDDGRPHRLRLYAGKAVKQEALYAVPVELRSYSDGREWLHARADIVLAAKLPAKAAPIGPAWGTPITWARGSLYERYFFHGPAFQGIERIDGCSEHGVWGVVASAPAPAAWCQQPLRGSWFADPL